MDSHPPYLGLFPHVTGVVSSEKSDCDVAVAVCPGDTDDHDYSWCGKVSCRSRVRRATTTAMLSLRQIVIE